MSDYIEDIVQYALGLKDLDTTTEDAVNAAVLYYESFYKGNIMNKQEYNTEINSIAENLVHDAWNNYDEVTDIEQAEELIQDSLLHETIDGHQWIIYYSYNDEVIRHSDNADAYQDIYSNEDVGALIADQGLDSFGTVRAFWAMTYDVQEQLEEALNNYEEENNEQRKS